MAKTNNLTDFLTDLADGIRAAKDITDAINPQDFREHVEGMVKPVLYGTYILDTSTGKTLPMPASTLTLFLPEAAAYANFGNGYNQISSIEFYDSDGHSTVDIFDGNAYYITLATDGWVSVYEATPEDYIDENQRILDFVQPVEVSRDFYEQFMVMVENTSPVITSYDIGIGMTNDATATASEILAGETAWVGGAQITGTMTNQGAKTQTLNTSTTSYTIPAGYHNGSGKVSITTETKSATPSTSSQDITPTSGKVLSKVTVAAIPNQKTASDVTVSGKTVSIPAGYYSSAVSKSVTSGSATTPATTISATPSISIDDNGLITASNSKTQSVTPTVSAGYVSSGTAGTITVSGSGTKQLTKCTSSSLTASGATVTAPAGYYPAAATKTISSGKAQTPATTITANPTVATTITSGSGYKVSVSASKSVTPTVTAGYVSSGTAGTITVAGSIYIPAAEEASF